MSSRMLVPASPKPWNLGTGEPLPVTLKRVPIFSPQAVISSAASSWDCVSGTAAIASAGKSWA